MDELKSYFTRLNLILIGEAAVRFIDPVVFSICLPIWDTDGDGYLTEKELLMSKEFPNNSFSGRSDINSLDDLAKIGEYTFFGNFNNMTNLKTAHTGNRYNSSKHCNTYQYCTSLNRIILHDNIETIGNKCFYGCSSLKEIVFGSKVKSIDNNAFEHCSSLKEISLPDTIESIGAAAFSRTSIVRLILPPLLTVVDVIGYCDTLTYVEIGTAVTKISGFDVCPNLSTFIIYAENPPETLSWLFQRSSIPYIYVPDASVDAYKTSNHWSKWAAYIKPISEMPTES